MTSVSRETRGGFCLYPHGLFGNLLDCLLGYLLGMVLGVLGTVLGKQKKSPKLFEDKNGDFFED